MNVLVLWLNDKEIIWDTLVGYEKESIDPGRSYVGKISLSVSSQDTLHTMEMVA